MKIAICDDKNSDINDLFQQLRSTEYSVELVCFTEGKQLFEYVSDKSNEITAVIIDIELADANGIKIANEIRALLPGLPIVFYTAYASKYAQNIFLESLELKPFALITKPPSDIIVKECLRQLAEYESKKILLRKKIIVKKGTETLYIECQNINYIESMDHTIILHTDNEIIKFSGRLKTFYKDLPNNFSFCHKSFIVNLDKVLRFSSTQCELYNREVIPISRRCKESFKDEILLYKSKYE